MARGGKGKAVGRPTDYRPDYCDQVVEFMRAGFSLTAFAGHIDVARSTINVWMEAHPEFSEAVSRAKAARLLHWEEAAIRVAKDGGGPGTATIIVFGLAAADIVVWLRRVVALEPQVLAVEPDGVAIHNAGMTVPPAHPEADAPLNR